MKGYNNIFLCFHLKSDELLKIAQFHCPVFSVDDLWVIIFFAWFELVVLPDWIWLPSTAFCWCRPAFDFFLLKLVCPPATWMPGVDIFFPIPGAEFWTPCWALMAVPNFWPVY
jgi:hypothetical protein